MSRVGERSKKEKQNDLSEGTTRSFWDASAVALLLLSALKYWSYTVIDGILNNERSNGERL